MSKGWGGASVAVLLELEDDEINLFVDCCCVLDGAVTVTGAES